MLKKNEIDILIIEKSYIIAKGLSDIAWEEFANVRVFCEVRDFDELMSIIEKRAISLVLLNSAILKDNIRYIHRLPESTIVIPIVTNSNDIIYTENFKYNINILDTKKEISDTLSRASEDLRQKEFKVKPEKDLTKREELILQMIAKGSSSKVIARQLGISLQTVSTHRKNITAKLSIKSISGLTVYAILNGLITTENNS